MIAPRAEFVEAMQQETAQQQATVATPTATAAPAPQTSSTSVPSNPPAPEPAMPPAQPASSPFTIPQNINTVSQNVYPSLDTAQQRSAKFDAENYDPEFDSSLPVSSRVPSLSTFAWVIIALSVASVLITTVSMLSTFRIFQSIMSSGQGQILMLLIFVPNIASIFIGALLLKIKSVTTVKVLLILLMINSGYALISNIRSFVVILGLSNANVAFASNYGLRILVTILINAGLLMWLYSIFMQIRALPHRVLPAPGEKQ